MLDAKAFSFMMLPIVELVVFIIFSRFSNSNLFYITEELPPKNEAFILTV